MKAAGATRLSVNVNKAALLRNSRPLDVPDLRHIAGLAIDGGAQGITVHPRPDQRHIRATDVAPLRELTRERGVEYNIEGNPFHAYMDYARGLRPEQCTLVPDAPGASTSDHGWDLARDGGRLRPVIAELKSLGIRVSLFMDPQASAMQLAADLGADRVELYTEPYARAHGTPGQGAALARYREAALAATRAGLGLNAGHDLNRANLPDFIAGVPGVLEVSIGHALIADALEFGMEQGVRLYLEAIARGRAQ
ncbi:MAG TPA: pyridoxine 5'-phosphate synthase [Burkholderiales bacterium]|jgi:pyridoxine 5-phosphate synthase|nr:pyridoxine 5'-phosphate synthase [Burkholderiales bacterium]